MKYDFNKLLEVVAALRGPDGCPWDKKQTLYSLKDQFIEEAYEVTEALENKDIPNLCEELGDILLHVALHAQIASEENLFNIEDVTDQIVRKLIRRHPHVFGDDNVESTDEVLAKWDEIKAQEKKDAGQTLKKSILQKANKPMPTLIKAEKLQAAAAKTGFDWPTPFEVLSKTDEELAELKEACQENNRDKIKEEIGDLLFVITNLARHYDIPAEEALKDANQKFVTRFQYIEETLQTAGKSLNESTLGEMEELWQAAKRQKIR